MNRAVTLLRVEDNQIVEATLMNLTQKHLQDAETYWEPLLKGSEQTDEYWNWQSKTRRAVMLPGGELYAIECEGMTQGLMTIDILKKRCQIQSQFRKRLVYIKALATAPWNRATISNPPRYKGVGSAFVNFAIARSHELDYKGRVGLHSLEEALGFYRRLRVGFLECGLDPEEPDKLIYFEILRNG